MKPLDGTFIVITRDHLPVFGTITDAVRINGLARFHMIRHCENNWDGMMKRVAIGLYYSDQLTQVFRTREDQNVSGH